MNQHKQINQTSGVVEYYTPGFVTDAARYVMGAIDLDPASSVKANETVKAKRFFTKDIDGLSRRWEGKVFMNHPFGIAEKTCDHHKLRIQGPAEEPGAWIFSRYLVHAGTPLKMSG